MTKKAKLTKTTIMLYLIVITCYVSSASIAAEMDRNIVTLQMEDASALDRAQILDNGEIWLMGFGQDWIVRANEDGTLAEEFYGTGHNKQSRIFPVGGLRCILRSEQDANTGEWQEVLIPLQKSGSSIPLLKMKYRTCQLNPIPSGILSNRLTFSNPWLTFYNENFNIVMTVDHPFDIIPDLIKDVNPLGIKTVEELTDGLLLFGQRNLESFYFMKISFEGKVDSYHEIQLKQDVNNRIDARDMMVLEDKILLVGREFGIIRSGDNFLLCVDFDGTIVWNKKIADANSCLILQQMRAVEPYGLIFWGNKDYGYIEVRDQGVDHGYLLTTTFDGEVVKEIDLPHIDSTFINGFLHDESFYLFGNGAQEYEDAIIWEKFDVASLFK